LKKQSVDINIFTGSITSAVAKYCNNFLSIRISGLLTILLFSHFYYIITFPPKIDLDQRNYFFHVYYLFINAIKFKKDNHYQ